MVTKYDVISSKWSCENACFSTFSVASPWWFPGVPEPDPPPPLWAMKLALFQAKVSFSWRRSVRGLQGNICCSAWSFRFKIPINRTRSYGCQYERLFANQFEMIIWNLNSDSNSMVHSALHNITMHSQKSSRSQAIYATHMLIGSSCTKAYRNAEGLVQNSTHDQSSG